MDVTQETILSFIKKIEIEHNVKVLYACESGSRAWGFPSANSDYDVRFIYVHPVEWYLSIRKQRDVIEYPIDEQLDVNGWDLQKALQLFRKSNPPLMDWLGSPIKYMEPYSTAQRMRELAKDFFSPIASSYHYLHMARGNYRDYLKHEQVRVKKYFYVLRPVLAVRWIERDLGVVPTEFDVLVDTLVEDAELKQAIEMLVEKKRAGDELAEGPCIEPISRFIEQEVARFEDYSMDYDKPPAPVEVLDELFLDTLTEVWGHSFSKG